MPHYDLPPVKLGHYRLSGFASFPPRLGFPVPRDYAITEGP
jgi:hypothetical protein